MAQTVLVTGSSRGIGKAIALKLAQSGYDIVLHCVTSKNNAEDVAESIINIGQNARVLQFDVSDREQAAKTLLNDIETHDMYYGIVCNAGITRDNAFPALTGSEWDDVLRTNLDGFYNVLNPLTMPMVRRKAPGRIVTLSSVSGIMGNRGQVNYSAAKAGIIGATKALALELAKRKITVNCVAPGVIETDMTEDLNESMIKDMIPLRRPGQAEEVASVVNFLISEEASYITRQVIAVNGGLC